MTSKKIKIECGGAGHDTKISVDGKDLLKEVPGIYGIELGIFVDGVTELKLYQRARPIEFNGKVKLIEVFGKESYCLVDPQYIKELKKQIERVKKGRDKAFQETDSLLRKNDELKREISALKEDNRVLIVRQKVKLEEKVGEQK